MEEGRGIRMVVARWVAAGGAGLQCCMTSWCRTRTVPCECSIERSAGRWLAGGGVVQSMCAMRRWMRRKTKSFCARWWLSTCCCARMRRDEDGGRRTPCTRLRHCAVVGVSCRVAGRVWPTNGNACTSLCCRLRPVCKVGSTDLNCWGAKPCHVTTRPSCFGMETALLNCVFSFPWKSTDCMALSN